MSLIFKKNFLEFPNFIISFLYSRIFHEEVSDEFKKFMSSVYYIAIGTVVGTLFSTAFSIIAGKTLGPTEYGKFTLVRSVGMFLYYPMLLGISTGMVKYNSEGNELSRQQKIISTSFTLVFIFTTIWVFILYILSERISSVLSVSYEIYYIAIAYAVAYVFYTMTTNALRSLHEMKKLAYFTPLENIILLALFLVFLQLNMISFKSMTFALIIAEFLAGSAVLLYLYRFLKLKASWDWAKKLTRYSSFTMFSGISSVIYTNIDKIYINKYLTINDVGIYDAYNYGSINITILLSGIFITVFFPTVSKYKNKTSVLKKLNTLTPYSIIVGFPCILACNFIILKLYGEKYPIDISLMLLFTFTAILVSWYRSYAWLFNSEGEKGVKITLLGTVSIAITDIILCIYLIPKFGLHGAIGATAIAYCTGLCIIYSQMNLIKKENNVV